MRDEASGHQAESLLYVMDPATDASSLAVAWSDLVGWLGGLAAQWADTTSDGSPYWPTENWTSVKIARLLLQSAEQLEAAQALVAKGRAR